MLTMLRYSLGRSGGLQEFWWRSVVEFAAVRALDLTEAVFVDMTVGASFSARLATSSGRN